MPQTQPNRSRHFKPIGVLKCSDARVAMCNKEGQNDFHNINEHSLMGEYFLIGEHSLIGEQALMGEYSLTDKHSLESG